jgi:hypothetical protein
MAKTREQILAEARRIVHEVELDLNTIASWNENVRQPHEEPISVEEYDPGGHLRSYVAHLRRVLATDRGHGPIGEIE